MTDEKTYIMVKPDGVQRGLVGEIIRRFEVKGYKLIGLKMQTPPKEHLEKHYADLAGKAFFPGLISYMTSGPVVVQVLEGENAVARNREIMGATNPDDADAGTIRKEFAESIEANSVHGSDAPETAAEEIAFFFKEDEIVG